MRVVFSELALEELKDATEHLESEFPGLGKAFRSDVARSKNLLSRFPLAGAAESGDIRHCLLHKFPYKLIYSIESDHVFIIEVAHQHREPNYWVDRTQ
jgi:plasmid stabilization system protein ParE